DARRDVIMTTPKDFGDALIRELNLAPDSRGAAAIRAKLHGVHGPEFMQRAATDGATVTWSETSGIQRKTDTHQVTVRTHIDLETAVHAPTAKESTYGASKTSATQTATNVHKGWGVDFAIIADLPAKLGYFHSFIGVGGGLGYGTASAHAKKSEITVKAKSD